MSVHPSKNRNIPRNPPSSVPVLNIEEKAWEQRYLAASEGKGSSEYPIHRLSPSAKYFIAVCKYGLHSYVMAGCDESQSEQPAIHVFSAVGKRGDTGIEFKPNCVQMCKALGGMFLGKNEAEVSDEQILKPIDARRSHRLSPVQYRAYEVTEQQYIDYTKLLRKIPSPQPFNFYYPITPRAADPDYDLARSGYRYAISSHDARELGVNLNPPEVKGELEQKQGRKKKADRNYESLLKIGINNTCRHSAIDILRRLKIVDKSISKYHGTRLPNKMLLQDGKIITPLFIVPIPPDLELKRANPLLHSVLKDLHKNIIRLSQTNYGLEQAWMKVRALSELYKQLHNTKKDRDGHNILAVLQAWKNQKQNAQGPDNLSLIRQARGQFMWTRSEKMLQKLENKTIKSIKPAPRSR